MGFITRQIVAQEHGFINATNTHGLLDVAPPIKGASLMVSVAAIMAEDDVNMFVDAKSRNRGVEETGAELKKKTSTYNALLDSITRRLTFDSEALKVLRLEHNCEFF